MVLLLYALFLSLSVRLSLSFSVVISHRCILSRVDRWVPPHETEKASYHRTNLLQTSCVGTVVSTFAH